MILLLAGFCGYLGMRLHAEKTENSALRKNIAHLKQRLNQRS